VTNVQPRPTQQVDGRVEQITKNFFREEQEDDIPSPRMDNKKELPAFMKKIFGKK